MEQLIVVINMLVQNFGVLSILGHKFWSYLEFSQLEMGVVGKLMELDYETYKDMAMPYWFTFSG